MLVGRRLHQRGHQARLAPLVAIDLARLAHFETGGEQPLALVRRGELRLPALLHCVDVSLNTLPAMGRPCHFAGLFERCFGFLIVRQNSCLFAFVEPVRRFVESHPDALVGQRLVGLLSLLLLALFGLVPFLFLSPFDLLLPHEPAAAPAECQHQ